ncbi:hypothetical protein ES703_115537 [subsurface metagenome]
MYCKIAVPESRDDWSILCLYCNDVDTEVVSSKLTLGRIRQGEVFDDDGIFNASNYMLDGRTPAMMVGQVYSPTFSANQYDTLLLHYYKDGVGDINYVNILGFYLRHT